MAPYARSEILWISFIGSAIAGGVFYFFHWWALIPLLLTAAVLSFYRDPPRRPPQEANLLLAPADGKIVEITRNCDAGDGHGPSLRIMIFLSVFNVHVNRSPCAGRVTDVKYQPGEFLNALNPECNTRNENNRLTLAPRPPLPGPIRVRQIAGVLAKRIVCVAKVGDELAVGKRFGMIKLGSRTEVCLPEDPRWDVAVTLGQHVKGGVTVLARLRREE